MSTATPLRTTDVFIAGGGIAASTFARILVDAGLSVIIADAGGQHSLRAGENLKNFRNYQDDVDQFGGIVRGLLHPVSIPPAANYAFASNALNPKQDALFNLPGAVVGYAVGGMAIHWTCAIPRHVDGIERIPFITAADWDNLYTEAEQRLNLHRDVFQDSLRHKVIKRLLIKHGWPVENTPLAAERKNKTYVEFSGADTVLGRLAEPGQSGRLKILQGHSVRRLQYDHLKHHRITSAVVRDLQTGEEKTIAADVFVVAAGWLHTAQLLWASGIHVHDNSALGRYLTDHTFTACQVILNKELLSEIAAEASNELIPPDLGPFSMEIPLRDPPPHLHIPVSPERPWHSMIFREAFQFDPLSPTIDSRLIVDLKWFGMIAPVESNRVTFERDIVDRFGMPQPTFHFQLAEDDKARQQKMIIDMQNLAYLLGEYVPGSEPKRIPLGASTHTMGATRMGDSQDNGRTSVVDPHSKVWGTDNLYVGGNCVIPTHNASNPTLTTVALAIRASKHILGSSIEPPNEPRSSTNSRGDIGKECL
jgi:pyranose oxidase